MPGLSVLEAPLAERPDVVRIALSGTLDIASLPQFEGALAKLRERGLVKVLVDLAKLDYISSSGLGAFLGTVDPFRKAGGDLAFVRASERVKKIFKVVGFHRILTLVDSEEDALKHFSPPAGPALEAFIMSASTAAPHSGEPFQIEIQASDGRGQGVESFEGEAALRPSLGIVSPSKVGPFVKGVWRGTVILTGPGLVSLRAAAEEASGESTFDVVETKPGVELPATIQCSGCRHASEISAFNVYRCQRCGEVYFVDRWAHVISLRSGAKSSAAPAKVLSIRMPADTALLGPLRLYLVAVLRESGYPAELVNDVELAADEAVTNVVEHAYGYDAAKTLELELALAIGQVTIKIRDTGTPFQPKAAPVDLDQHIEERRTGGLGVFLMNSFMDSVDYQHLDGANVLTMVKKVGGT